MLRFHLLSSRYGRRVVGGLCSGHGGAEGEIAGAAGGDEGGAVRHGDQPQEAAAAAAQAAPQRPAGAIFYTVRVGHS